MNGSLGMKRVKFKHKFNRHNIAGQFMLPANIFFVNSMYVALLHLLKIRTVSICILSDGGICKTFFI